MYIMTRIFILFCFAISTMSVFADSTQVDCCKEISNILKIQNEIMSKYITRNDSFIYKKNNYSKAQLTKIDIPKETGREIKSDDQKNNSIILINNCGQGQTDKQSDKQSDKQLNLIDIIAQIATILALLIAIYQYWSTEYSKKKDKLDTYKSLSKYFYDRIDSLINYIDRQSIHFKSFTTKLDDTPFEQNIIKFESNNDSMRIQKIESEKLYESIRYLNKANRIDSDYYYLLYGAEYIKELEIQAKNQYENKYLIEIKNLHNILYDIRNNTKYYFKIERANMPDYLKSYDNLLFNLPDNLQLYYLGFYKQIEVEILNKDKRGEFDNKTLELAESFINSYNTLLTKNESFKNLFDGFKSKYEEISKSMKIYRANLNK